MKPREECSHLILNFGSGDFYIFCHACGARWACVDTDDMADSTLANKGFGGHLSGHARVAAMGAK
jgi:hypothetical protein